VEGVNRVLLLFALIAIAARGIIPAGWMPTGERSFEISICTGMEMQKAWLDSEGKVHKQDPTKKDAREKQPCAFSGLAMATPFAGAVAVPHPAVPLGAAHDGKNQLVSIGRGLAAPPPPATGPPSLI
jgi:hypothetical protein